MAGQWGGVRSTHSQPSSGPKSPSGPLSQSQESTLSTIRCAPTQQTEGTQTYMAGSGRQSLDKTDKGLKRGAEGRELVRGARVPQSQRKKKGEHQTLVGDGGEVGGRERDRQTDRYTSWRIAGQQIVHQPKGSSSISAHLGFPVKTISTSWKVRGTPAPASTPLATTSSPSSMVPGTVLPAPRQPASTCPASLLGLGPDALAGPRRPSRA